MCSHGADLHELELSFMGCEPALQLCTLLSPFVLRYLHVHQSHANTAL